MKVYNDLRENIKSIAPMKFQGEREFDPFGEIFNKALVAIEKRYIAGSISYGERMLPSIVKEILSLEAKINEVWKRNRKEDIDEFRELLKRWYFLNLSIIEKYKKQMGKKKSMGSEIDVVV